MRMNILNKGDKVLNVTNRQISIERNNGEVEVIRIYIDEMGIWVADSEPLTIGFINNDEELEVIDNVVITNF